jgi:hypothetical protein
MGHQTMIAPQITFSTRSILLGTELLATKLVATDGRKKR